jgi:hypothetical protein
MIARDSGFRIRGSGIETEESAAVVQRAVSGFLIPAAGYWLLATGYS